jgi:hypothetical protein
LTSLTWIRWRAFDRIVDAGDYTPPDPLDDLELSKQLCLEYYAKGKLNNLSEERLELLRRYLAQINEIEQAMLPPIPMGAPGAGLMDQAPMPDLKGLALPGAAPMGPPNVSGA